MLRQDRRTPHIVRTVEELCPDPPEPAPTGETLPGGWLVAISLDNVHHHPLGARGGRAAVRQGCHRGVLNPLSVHPVVRQKDETSGQEVIRWMNVTRYLKNRKDKKSRQVIFEGEKLDMEAVWKVRDAYFAPMLARARNG
jgi:hypothetical protein